MLYKYKDAFSLRDEICTCTNIEVEIDVTDKSSFFIRPYHVNVSMFYHGVTIRGYIYKQKADL